MLYDAIASIYVGLFCWYPCNLYTGESLFTYGAVDSSEVLFPVICALSSRDVTDDCTNSIPVWKSD